MPCRSAAALRRNSSDKNDPTMRGPAEGTLRNHTAGRGVGADDAEQFGISSGLGERLPAVLAPTALESLAGSSLGLAALAGAASESNELAVILGVPVSTRLARTNAASAEGASNVGLYSSPVDAGT